MKHKHYITPYIVFATLIILVLGLTACGSGGGGGGNSNNNPGGGNPLIITGQAIKGPVSGGTVTAYAVASGAKGAVLKTVVTDAGGNYNLSIDSYSGPVFLEITGGSYIDEATGNLVNLPTTAGSGLQAVIDNVSAGSTVQSQITPLTTMAVARAQNMSGGLTPSNINAANQETGAYFGGINLLTTQPVNPLVSNSSTGATQEAINYGLILGGLSQQAQLLGLTNPLDLVSALVEDSSDGSFDGQSGSGSILLNGSPMNTTTGNVDLATAISTFSGDTIHNVSGGTVSSTLITSLQNSGNTPAAPTGVNATPGDGQVTVSWNPVSGATSYNVYMASQSGVTKSNYGTFSGGMLHSNDTSPFVHTGLINGTTYYFVVTAVNAIGESIESNEASATPATSVTIPNAPSNLQAAAVSSTQVNLTWTDNSVNEDGFRIDRKTGAAGTYNEIASVGSNITNYSDSASLVANTIYCYQVRASNGTGNSGYSNESCTTTPQSGTIPVAPTGVTATPGDGQVTVNWSTVSDATAYNIYMASQSGVTKSNYNSLLDGMVHTNVTSPFVHTGLTNGKTYYFVVTAVNTNGESTESNEVSSTPTAAVIIPNAPGNLQATAVSITQINLTWTDNSVNEDGFKIERKTGAGGTYSQIANVGSNISNFSNTTGLSANTVYCYQVRAFNANGNSGYSNESCTATPQSGTVPSVPTGVAATPGDSQVTISWNTVTGATSYNLYMASQSGVMKNNYNTLANGKKQLGVTSPYIQMGLTNGTTYYFVVTAVNANGESAESIEVTGTPAAGILTGTFNLTGSMNHGRSDHTATLLSNGKVLIAGGSFGAVSSLASAEIYNPVTGTFSFTGSMGDGRNSHTATLLPNGKVLIAGGDNGNDLASTELYDPATGTFTPTYAAGSMKAARQGHVAVLLPNGKVLIVGGWANGFCLATAEIYDPATGTFTFTGSMHAAPFGGRYRPTATLLPNGKVLIAGGGTDAACCSLASAEIYDPATGTFTFTGSMNATRSGHTATLLPSGKVLIVGGEKDIVSGTSVDSIPLASAELYDPTSGTFTFTGSMTTARFNHTATLLSNGKVLIAGSYNDSSAELYDPVTSTFSATGSMSTKRFNHTATLLSNGKVLIAGGYSSTFLASAEMYDPATSSTAPAAPTIVATAGNGEVTISWNPISSATSYNLYMATQSEVTRTNYSSLPNGLKQTGVNSPYHQTDLINGTAYYFVVTAVNANGEESSESIEVTSIPNIPTPGTFSPTGSMTTARFNHTATLLSNGKVLITGGAGGNYLASAEIYDPSNFTFSSTGSMNTARYRHIVILLPNGNVLVAGGSSGSTPFLASAELYDPATGTFSATGSMNTARFAPAATLLPNGKVLVTGGHSGIAPLASAELYDSVTGIFSSTGSMSIARSGAIATLLSNGKVLVTGGYSGATAELYDPATGTFSATGSMSAARYAHTATLLPNGKVLIAGGYSNTFLASAELYDPSTGTFTSTGSMRSRRDSHTATLLSNGKVLIAGGSDGFQLSSAELYDPATGKFSATGSMSMTRHIHTATLLLNGKVIVAGGDTEGSAELYQ